jgi:hypothetical protein
VASWGWIARVAQGELQRLQVGVESQDGDEELFRGRGHVVHHIELEIDVHDTQMGRKQRCKVRGADGGRIQLRNVGLNGREVELLDDNVGDVRGQREQAGEALHT